MKAMLVWTTVMLIGAVSFGADIRLESGMPVETAAALLSQVAIDMTPAVNGNTPDGQVGVCWQVTEANVVVWLYSIDGRLVEVGYWTLRDFSLSAFHRTATERRAVNMVINADKGSVLLNPVKREYGADYRNYDD